MAKHIIREILTFRRSDADEIAALRAERDQLAATLLASGESINQLRKAIAELRQALKPFAKHAEYITRESPFGFSFPISPREAEAVRVYRETEGI